MLPFLGFSKPHEEYLGNVKPMGFVDGCPCVDLGFLEGRFGNVCPPATHH